jgi:hypothetical protein
MRWYPVSNLILPTVLQVEAYPTHFVINKEGRIVKRLTDYRGMAYILKKEVKLH